MTTVPNGSWTIHKAGTDEDGTELFVLLVGESEIGDKPGGSWNLYDEMDERELIGLLKQIGISDVAIGAALHRARERFGPIH
jgi:hypothetical protein